MPNSSRPWRDPITWATVTIAVATVFYVIVSFGLWQVTRESTEITKNLFETTNRPYVGVRVADVQKDEAGRKLKINVEVKNFGNIPASELQVRWDILVDGVPSPKLGPSPSSLMLFPQTSMYLVGGVTDAAQYSSIVKGNSPLEFVVEIQYKGLAGKQYYVRQNGRYLVDLGTFGVSQGQYR